MKILETECLVIGGGPGGYTAAFYAADHNIKTTLIERYPRLGGVCLNVGCIPSKALLHLAALKEETKELETIGIGSKDFKINLAKTRTHKGNIVQKLTGGLNQLAKARKVNVINGVATFIDANNVLVKENNEETRIVFNQAIIAAGSRPIIPKSLALNTDRVMTSTGALDLKDIPEKLLVIGGGIIGMEMGYVYASFGSAVTMVEALPHIGTGIDRDVFTPLERKLKRLFKSIQPNTTVSKITQKGNKIIATFTPNEPKSAADNSSHSSQNTTAEFDRVLVSVGRRANSDLLDLEKAMVHTDDHGFIKVDNQLRTNVSNIYAIGDIVGNPMLAHKASREAHIAVEALMGKKTTFDNIVIPNVIYTDPEVAWAGMTEAEVKEQNIPYKTGVFPWAASGRALAIGKTAGTTKIIFHSETERLLGVAMCGTGAGELIAEAVLAIEMGAVVSDITETIHAHPTLSETFLEAAEAGHGLSTHYFSRKR
ncbi:dihydrolipoyl dehydrogenase [Spirochaetota bacterium]|nr:dihydrolipoyl dehydrogenase [Spirochaetota bacterium]